MYVDYEHMGAVDQARQAYRDHVIHTFLPWVVVGFN